MNNNYHTQLNKQNNILNEVAANNQLLQNTLPPLNPQGGYSGVTFNKNLPPGYQTNQVPYLQQGHVVTQPASGAATQSQDELELSDSNLDLNQASDRNMVDGSGYVAEQKTSQNVVGRKTSAKQTLFRDGNLALKVEPHSSAFSGKYLPRGKDPVHISSIKNMSNKDGSTFEYVVVPIILIVGFIILVHPRMSKFLERYLPKMDSMKGCLVRGAILAIIYIVARFFLDSTGKNKITKN